MNKKEKKNPTKQLNFVISYEHLINVISS